MIIEPMLPRLITWDKALTKAYKNTKIFLENTEEDRFFIKNKPTTIHAGKESPSHRLISRSLDMKLKVAIIANCFLNPTLTLLSPPCIFPNVRLQTQVGYIFLWQLTSEFYYQNNLNHLSDLELITWVNQAFKLGLTSANGVHVSASSFMLAYKKWSDQGYIRHESNRHKRRSRFTGIGKAAAVIAV